MNLLRRIAFHLVHAFGHKPFEDLIIMPDGRRIMMCDCGHERIIKERGRDESQ